MMGWRVGQWITVDGKTAKVVKVTNRADNDLLIKNKATGKPGVAIDWESVERLPSGKPRRLGRMIR